MTWSPVMRRRDNRSCNSSRGRSCHRYHLAGRLPRSLTRVAPEVEARHYATPRRVRRQKRIAATLASGHVARKEARMLATIATTPAPLRSVAVPERMIGYTIVDSPSSLPLGRLLVGATTRGVCAVQLGPSDAALEAELAREHPDVELRRDGAPLAPWVNTLLRHLAGQEARLDLPLDVEATAFQQPVWQALRAIPYGETRSYGAVAEAVGHPGAARAVARACAANPVALVIPCHRVVRGDGDPGGYRWGVARKRLLLEQERRAAQRAERRVLRDLIDAIGGGTPGPVPAEGPLAAGEVLAGRYEIDRVLGAGGMGG